MRYQIKIRGHLEPRWEMVFNGFSFEYQVNARNKPVTLMTGHIPDQSALFGIISRIRNSGLELISIQPLDENRSINGKVNYADEE